MKTFLRIMLVCLLVSGLYAGVSVCGANDTDGQLIQPDEAVMALPWDYGSTDIGSGWRNLTWFGNYAPLGCGWLYHQQHDYLYVTSSSAAHSIFFYMSDGDSWFWTSSTVYPIMYRFADNTWYYYEMGSDNPRNLYNFTTQLWEQH